MRPSNGIIHTPISPLSPPGGAGGKSFHTFEPGLALNFRGTPEQGFGNQTHMVCSYFQAPVVGPPPGAGNGGAAKAFETGGRGGHGPEKPSLGGVVYG